MACFLGRSGWSEGSTWRSAGDWTGGGHSPDLCSVWLSGGGAAVRFPPLVGGLEAGVWGCHWEVTRVREV